MFKSLTNLIDLRLGRGLVLYEASDDSGFLIKINHRYLYTICQFLKKDPDVRFDLLENIFLQPCDRLTAQDDVIEKKYHCDLLYQFRSTTLPYRVTVTFDVDKDLDIIPSIASLFIGARWLEEELVLEQGVRMEDALGEVARGLDVKTHIEVDDSLIISRMQQRELYDAQLSRPFLTSLPILADVVLKPFFDNLPIKLGVNIKLIGEKIIELTLDRGYLKQGIENLLSGQPAARAVSIIDRLNLAMPLPYQLAMMNALEELSDWPREPLTKKRYAIALEFTRIAHNLRVIKDIFFCLDLIYIANLIDQMTNPLADAIHFHRRVYIGSEKPASLILAGVEYSVLEALQAMEELQAAITNEDGLEKRMLKKAVIPAPLAGSLGLTGPYLRANRVNYDTRKSFFGKKIYDTSPVAPLMDGGDLFARFCLRVIDIEASLRWLRDELLNLKKEMGELSPITIDQGYCDTDHEKEQAFGEVAGPEGDIRVFLHRRADHFAVKLGIPALFIAQSLPLQCAQIDLGDFALLLHSCGITAEEVDR